MLRYSEIIEKLSLDDKLQILTNGSFLATAHKENKDLPYLSIGEMVEVNDEIGDEYPSFYAMANSWNYITINEVAKVIAHRAMEQGMNALLLPDANVRSNVYSSGASEDPYLLGSLMSACAKAVEGEGITPILANCSLKNSDVAYADIEPNARAIMEYYLKSFKIAASEIDNLAVITSYTLLKDKYEKINLELIRELIDTEIASKHNFLICERTAAEYVGARLNAGYALCTKGHTRILKEAVINFMALSEAVQEGLATAEELEDAIEEGRAISEDTVDSCVDMVLDFAFRCENRMRSRSDSGNGHSKDKMIKFSESTVVLLKNESNALPIRNSRIAVIGQIAKRCSGKTVSNCLQEKAKDVGAEYIGFQDGYDLAKSRSDEYFEKAKDLARNADTIVVFLGFDEEREESLASTKCLKLPGSQIALLEELAALNRRIIAVVSGSGRVDMSFDGIADAVLYAPDTSAYSGEALANLLLGLSVPSGKLPFTMYDLPDERASRERFYKDGGYNKVGVFVGYRRYDADGEKVKYPFGHGLSYTKFVYSDIRTYSDRINVTITNTGQYEATEIVQFYYGKKQSSVLRPKKELFAFARVRLMPHEKKTISVTWEDKYVSIYNADEGQWEVESGEYTIYAASSVTDERLSTNYYIAGKELPSCGEDTMQYLQGKSNITSGGYFMDTKMKQKKFTSKAPALGIISIILAVLCDVFMIFFAKNIMFFDVEVGGKWLMGILLAVFNGLMVIGIVCMIKASKRKKEHDKQMVESVLKHDPEVEEKVAKPAKYEQLFIDEFRCADDGYEDEELEEEKEIDKFVIKEKVDVYHRPDWNFEQLQKELITFLAERGIIIDSLNARTLLSAMSVSRLVILKPDKGMDIYEFMCAISQFFGSRVYADRASKYSAQDDLLYYYSNNYWQTNLSYAIEDAAADEYAMKIANLVDVKLDNLGTYFTQFMRYIVRPEVNYSISLKNKSISDKTFELTPNLWIFMSLALGEALEDLPITIAEAASFVRIHFTKGEAKETKTQGRAISAAQFLSFGDKAKNEFELDESKWKRVDKLEEYVRVRAGYRISNKLMLKMEKFASVFISLGGESDEALDSVVAVKMLATMLMYIKNNRRENDEKLFIVLENILGEDNTNMCRAVIDASMVDNGEHIEAERIELAAMQEKTKEQPIEPVKKETESVGTKFVANQGGEVRYEVKTEDSIRYGIMSEDVVTYEVKTEESVSYQFKPEESIYKYEAKTEETVKIEPIQTAKVEEAAAVEVPEAKVEEAAAVEVPEVKVEEVAVEATEAKVEEAAAVEVPEVKVEEVAVEATEAKVEEEVAVEATEAKDEEVAAVETPEAVNEGENA